MHPIAREAFPLMLIATGVAQRAPAADSGPTRREYTQDVELHFATAEAAAAARVSLAPVLDNKAWAFSARWDDNQLNSLNMREHMAAFGLRGTFYLTASNQAKAFGPDYARALSRDGFSVGGHSMSHPKLAQQPPDRIFYEILANRIQRESETDRPLNSFAFPYGNYQDAEHPRAKATISAVLLRSGYHHCVYKSFVENNPDLPEHAFSTGLQVVPGDRKVEAERFWTNLDKIVAKWPDAFRKTSHCIFLGVHAWQQGEEWDKLDRIFRRLGSRQDWWHCNQTEYAAYARQHWFSRIEPGPIAGASRQMRLVRPSPAELGAALPLTLLVSGPEPLKVQINGNPTATRRDGETTVVNVAPPAGQDVPWRISWIRGPETATTALSGIAGSLAVEDKHLTLFLANASAADLRDLWITFRLPLALSDAVPIRQVARLASGAETKLRLALPAVEPSPTGPRFLVAEIDFRGERGLERLYVTGQH